MTSSLCFVRMDESPFLAWWKVYHMGDKSFLISTTNSTVTFEVAVWCIWCIQYILDGEIFLRNVVFLYSPYTSAGQSGWSGPVCQFCDTSWGIFLNTVNHHSYTPRMMMMKFASSPKWSSSSKTSLVLCWTVSRREEDFSSVKWNHPRYVHSVYVCVCFCPVAAAVNNPPAWQTNRLPGRNSDGCFWPAAVISSALPPDNSDSWTNGDAPKCRHGLKKRKKHSVVGCVRHVSPFRQRRLSITCTGSGKSVLGLPTPRVLHELHRDVSESGEGAPVLRQPDCWGGRKKEASWGETLEEHDSAAAAWIRWASRSRLWN